MQPIHRRLVIRMCLPALLGLIIATAPLVANPAAKITFDLALYFGPEPKGDPEAALNTLLATRSPTQTERVSVRHRWERIEDYAPPTPEAFRYVARGLAHREGAAIAQSSRVFVLTFQAEKPHVLAANHESDQLLAELADLTDGFPWDEECRLLYSRAKWREERVDTWEAGLPDVRTHVNMHAYRNPELVRIITLGMRKFALPDLVMTDVVSGTSTSAGNVINACAQRLIEGQRAEDSRLSLVLADIEHTSMRESSLSHPLEGATGRVTVLFRPAAVEEGDPANDLWQLDFPDNDAATYTERQVKAFAQVFGSSDEIVEVSKHDAEMREASGRARSAFAAKLPQLRKGFAPNERLVVKAPFAVDGGNEYMWVEVTGWKDDAIEGILMNDARGDPTLRHGLRVTIALKDVYDYIHYLPDGTEEGNETGKVLEKRTR